MGHSGVRLKDLGLNMQGSPREIMTYTITAKTRFTNRDRQVSDWKNGTF